MNKPTTAKYATHAESSVIEEYKSGHKKARATTAKPLTSGAGLSLTAEYNSRYSRNQDEKHAANKAAGAQYNKQDGNSEYTGKN